MPCSIPGLAISAATELVAAVGGGLGNQASGGLATIAGGQSNQAGGIESAVGGGRGNEATGAQATVAGGFNNTASGQAATIPGGEGNSASGPWSFAAGRRARALHQGSVLFADSTDADFDSTAADELAARATGGFRFVSAVDGAGATTAECTIDAGANLTCDGSMTATAFNTSSDRDAKTRFEPVDPGEILEGVAELPITTWSFRDRQGVRHIGPTAQDFYAAFGGLGTDDRHISTVDADGVALTAIQELERLLAKQRRMNHRQRDRLDRLRARVEALR